MTKHGLSVDTRSSTDKNLYGGGRVVEKVAFFIEFKKYLKAVTQWW